MYRLNRPSRTNPASVIPTRSASSTARVEGAPTAANTGTPATAAFCTSSNPARPLTHSTFPPSGNSPRISAAPSSLSTALCRPTSSRAAINSPDAVNSPAACKPPHAANPGCAARSVAGSPSSTAAETRRSSAGSGSQRCSTASMLVLPHTPHAADVYPLRACRAGSTDTCGASSSRTAFGPSSWTACRSARDAIKPSERASPAANSASWPGVRRVTARTNRRRPGPWVTRTSSGSSTATASARGPSGANTGTGRTADMRTW